MLAAVISFMRLVIFSILGSTIRIDDYSFVSLVCPCVWAELGIHTGFIIHKAKVENLNRNVPLDNASWNGNVNIDV